MESKMVVEKDGVELELEKLVFGDTETFRREVVEFDEAVDGRDPLRASVQDFAIKQDKIDRQKELEALADSELFFLDSGPAPGSANNQIAALSKEVGDEAAVHEKPVWADSDDERLMVSLLSSNRLRKLRRQENENHINGAEYVHRLREQYERLHPRPAWALYLQSGAGDTHRRKRRRLSESTTDSATGSEEDGDTEGIPSAQPLADLLRGTSSLVQRSARKTNGRISFRPDTLDIQRTKDVSGSSPSSVTSLSFHPSLPLLLSSGPSGLIVLHHIAPAAPTPNPTLTRIALRRLPIRTAVFHPSGTRAILTARRRYYHIWDLESGRFDRVAGFASPGKLQRNFDRSAPSPCGRYIAFVGSARKGGGYVNIVDANTGQWACTGRVEGRGGVADLAWWRSGDGLCILGKGGEVLEYSVRERRPLARWTDEGAVGATCIALGGPKKRAGLGGDRYVAVASSSGIVNMYDRSSWKAPPTTASEEASGPSVPPQPTPKRTFDQLVTSISVLQFSPDGQLLAMASQEKRDALRIVHVPSCTVYRNWPTSDTPLGRISSLAWGEVNEEGELVLAIANDQGKIRLWQVRG